MTGSMYAAIAGLKTHMNKLNVIGHNVANVNTQGYKCQRMVFKDAMYTMYRGGSNGTTTVAGMNPAQIGYGSQVSTIDLNMGSGSYSPGRTLDCMIDGDGFFLVGSKEVAGVIDATNPNTFKSLTLTRVGNFGFDANGYLTDGESCVYGFLTTGYNPDGTPIVSDQLVPIRIPRAEKRAIALKDGTAPDGTTFKAGDDVTAFYDTLQKGEFELKQTVKYPITESTDAQNNKTTIPLKDYWPTEKDANGNDVPVDSETNPLGFAELDGISIDSATGQISGTVKGSDEHIIFGYLAIGNVTNVNGVTHTGGSYFSCGDGAGDLTISMLGGAQTELGLTHVNGSLAPQPDPNDPNAEVPELSRKAEIGSAGGTKLNTGGLEGSNVDLATEISDMITTQRGYQANTRIITVTDTMLEELVNMKR